MTTALDGGEAPNRLLITVSIMLATLMQTLDSTIANVALPHMQGSLQAAQDQVTWILTSYIVAAAITTPVIPWLAGRFGRKTVLLVSVAGFTVSSLLCGLAQNLPQMVGFRLLQGVFGAALMPLAQTILLDINPREKHGQAMAAWAMAVMIGPVVGPALGGWLTDNYSWRWVFLINLPGGILAFTGLWLFLGNLRRAEQQKFDFFGFGTLVLGIGALQLMLDRGASNDWFASVETWIELILAGIGAYLFVVHTLTAQHPFFDRGLAQDRNFVAATIGGFFIMSVLFSVLALLPPMLENLMGYPVMTTGLVTMPRGLGMFLIMFVVGRLNNKVDTRLMIAVGLLLNALSLYAMSRFSLEMDSWPVVWTGFLQGVGIGLIFVPLSTIAFVTLPGALRSEGSAVFTLVRNIGSAVGISVMQAVLIANNARVHSNLVEPLRPDNPIVQQMTGPLNLHSQLGAAILNGLVNKQAAMVAYVNNYRMMAVATLLVLPILLLLRKPPGPLPKTDVHLE